MGQSLLEPQTPVHIIPAMVRAQRSAKHNRNTKIKDWRDASEEHHIGTLLVERFKRADGHSDDVET